MRTFSLYFTTAPLLKSVIGTKFYYGWPLSPSSGSLFSLVLILKRYLCLPVCIWTCVSTGQCRTTRGLSLEINYRLVRHENDMPGMQNKGCLLPAFFIRQQKVENDLFWSHLTLTKQCITDKMLIYCCKENNGSSC